MRISDWSSDVCSSDLECREQQVLRHNVGARQAVEQRRFAGVGIADQRDHRPGRALPPAAMQPARSLDLIEYAPQPRHAIADHPAVGFDLRFAGAAEKAEAAALAFEVGPTPHQPPGLILEMRSRTEEHM